MKMVKFKRRVGALSNTWAIDYSSPRTPSHQALVYIFGFGFRTVARAFLK